MNDGGLLLGRSQSEDSTAITELKELRTSSQAVLAENQKLLAEVGKVKKSVHSLRKALNGPSADLATLNAQLRAENETLKAVVVRATLAVLPPPPSPLLPLPIAVCPAVGNKGRFPMYP